MQGEAVWEWWRVEGGQWKEGVEEEEGVEGGR